MIQGSSNHIDLDDDDAYLGEARERFTHAQMKRYLAMFRPDILHYAEHWSIGRDGSYGWGYVTRESWDRWMGEDYDGSVTPEQAFDAEVKVYGKWAEGDIYGSCHVANLITIGWLPGHDCHLTYAHGRNARYWREIFLAIAERPELTALQVRRRLAG